jgi:diguanylate cyclase (GGDEF)-like protein
MIDYKKELRYYEQYVKHESLSYIQQHLTDLKKRLLMYEQYQDVCDVYYLQMTHYFWHGRTIQALKIYLENRRFIDQYASKVTLINMRYASCLLLDTLGFYHSNVETLQELLTEALALHLDELTIDIYNNLGYYAELANDFSTAKQYYTSCIDYFESHAPIQKDVSYLLSILNICHVYLKEHHHDEAARYLKKFETVATTDVTFTQIVYMARKVKLYMIQEDFEAAQLWAQKYLDMDLEQLEFHLVLGHLDTIADLYERLEMTDEVTAVLERSIQYAEKLRSHTIKQYATGLFQAAQEAELLDELKKDALTNAYTRASFEKYVSPLLALQPQVYKVLAMIDLDYFKQINDTHGHLVGDEILKTIASRANHYKHPFIKGNTQLFGRYGGDEFYMYFETTQRQHAEMVLAHLHAHLTEGDYVQDNIVIPLSVTIGAIYSQSTAYSFADWLACADARLYEAKKQQRGTLMTAHWDCFRQSEQEINDTSKFNIYNSYKNS